MFSPFGRGDKLVSTVLDAELELALRWEITTFIFNAIVFIKYQKRVTG